MKITIENLPSHITEETLRNIFSQIGEVQSVRIKTDILSGKPNGEGVVEMALEVDGYRAINCFEGALFTDRQIHVKEAYPLLEKAKIAFEHLTDGNPLHNFNPRESFERWKEQLKIH